MAFSIALPSVGNWAVRGAGAWSNAYCDGHSTRGPYELWKSIALEISGRVAMKDATASVSGSENARGPQNEFRDELVDEPERHHVEAGLLCQRLIASRNDFQNACQHNKK